MKGDRKDYKVHEKIDRNPVQDSTDYWMFDEYFHFLSGGHIHNTHNKGYQKMHQRAGSRATKAALVGLRAEQPAGDRLQHPHRTSPSDTAIDECRADIEHTRG